MTDVALCAPSPAAAVEQSCAHCGEVLRGLSDSKFCCAGCAGAHAIIGAAGLASFYRRLEERHARRPEPLETDFAGHAHVTGRNEAALDLLVEGLDCAACVWLIESLLARNPAITKARVHLSTRRLSLGWRGPAEDANAHAGLVAALGFKVAPYDIVAANAGEDRDTRDLLRSLGTLAYDCRRPERFRPELIAALKLVESGDVEEALGAASAVGDDTIQRRVQGEVVPESFTHGSAQQRVQWFRRGLESGSIEGCDTFRQRS